MICPAIDNPASCEICVFIRFLRAKSMGAAEIHFELCAAVYGQNIISEGTVRQWYRMFKDGRKMFTMQSEVVGRPSVVSDDLIKTGNQKI
jgi:hypothetical protein